ncbi:serine/arginine-rich splicing factor 4 [Acyrthosiphon pisum]|uniref:CHHC U11-48K-type domain-containing protein n=2 Tax=Acyrthosiphon pisum TaxID=7029 RepID=A0A8R1W3R9_ACYPI|nr:serine/arginine-rich splicing factor 4 [Acyrthosiphon pisum]|eukprot:XP_003240028.1 PREDICTED: serine/arginine-rich splicing factor 4-like [Acyrthosiphon pisum]
MDLSTEELLSRKETLKQFENYIDKTSDTLKCFVEKIGWTLDKTPVNDKLVKCPFNNEHRMPPSTLEVHCQKCILKKNGYDSSHSFYPSYNLSTPLAHSVKIDKITQMRILKTAYEESNSTLNINLEPREVSQSIERYVCDFTPDERRVLYDSAVKNTKLPNHKNVINDLTGVDVYNKTDDKPKTELEILQEQRDLKRRSAAYRGKKVHTDRKSYVEILREVVEGLTNNLAHSEDRSVCIQTSNTITETTPNDRFVYKYAGNQSYDGNPYTRWLDIETEESKLFKYCQKESQSSYQEESTSRISCKDKTGFKKSRKSKSKSRERKMSTSELKLRSKRSWSRTVCKSRKSRSKSREKKMSTNESKLKRSRRSRSSSVSKETKYKKPKIRSRSKEYVSAESKHKRSRKRKTRSKSKESESRRHRSRSISLENTEKRSKKHRTRSESKELEKIKCSRSLTNYNKLLNEKDSTIQFEPGNTHKKKKKHKNKKNHSKSPRRSYKNNIIEVSKNIEAKISNDNDVIHPIYQS